MPRNPNMYEGETAHFVTFDTHKYVKELEASGFPEEQAEVLIKSMLAARYYDVSQLATREQVEKLEKTTREQVEKLEKEIKEELKKFITREQLQAEIASVKYDILKWIIPMFIAIIGLMVSIFIKLH